MRTTRRAVAVIGGAIGGLALAAAGVSPEDADSHISAWLKHVGVAQPPIALASKSADHAVQFAALVVIALCACLFFDLLPHFRRLFQRPSEHPEPARTPEIVIERRILAEFTGIQDTPQSVIPDLWLVTFLVGVRNGRQDKRTLRRVTARLHTVFGNPQPLPSYPGDSLESDLRHGEVLHFELASVISNEIIGVPSYRLVSLTEAEMKIARDNMSNGPFVEIGRRGEGMRMIAPRNLPTDTTLLYTVMVSADDAEASALNIRLNGRAFPDLFAPLEAQTDGFAE